LTVTQEDGKYVMDFPAIPPEACEPDPVLFDALGVEPESLMASVRDYFAIYPDEATLAALKPNMFRLCNVERFAVICTAPGDNVDFVSRFFAPKQGVPEDPVTGSAHTTLIPYWADRLGKTALRARQISPRGGDVWCEHRGDRVTIAGHGVLYLEGTIEV
jgi:predicted PhzF superfamily epimerase YddE/YHI9